MINDRLNEKSELKIVREMCLTVLWNMITKPTNIKYLQINNHSLINNLKRKCNELGADSKQVINQIEYQLKQFGFENGVDSNWYYYNQIQLLWLWECYCKWIITQQMYDLFVLFQLK